MSTPVSAVPVRITKSVVDRLITPSTGQAFTRDSELKGFAVRITTFGAKSFILEKRIDGKVKRLTLGRYPELTVEQARREAQRLLGHIATGRNPTAEKKQKELQATTLQKAFSDFLLARKNLKPRTLYDYQRLMKVAFPDWQNKALIEISKEMVAKRHIKIGAERGEAYANLAMRFLRALFNFSIAQYEDSNGNTILRENPVVRLSQTRSWYRVDRRNTVIKAHDLPLWFKAVYNLKDDALGCNRVKDYLLLLLFTGLRREEGLSLPWSQVDLKARTLTIPDPKNRQPHVLPLTDFLHDLLAQRHAERTENPFVFPGDGVKGYFNEPRKQMQKVVKESNVAFTLHDLRRTFITIAESLDISAYALKRLANHKMANDVTAGYIISDVERLRDPMQRITSFLLASMRASDSTDTGTVTVSV